MRVSFLILGASLALVACKNNDVHDNTANVDENLTAENIVSNDVTAIDAVTGDSANMAADVDVNEVSNDAASAAQPPSQTAKPRAPRPTRVTQATPGNSVAPTDESATNSD